MSDVDQLAAAQGGDREAFAALVEPYQRELQAHCYRMLGSSQDAEDVLQETLLAAWVGLPGFEGRSSVRTWLYRIATNRCLNALRGSARRESGTTRASTADPAPARPTHHGEVLWLQPYPDVLLGDIADPVPGPEARYESTEAISLAFVTAVQLLPPRQRAVLLLRDVLGFRAREVAAMLDLTEEAVTSALKRARATLAERRPDPDVARASGEQSEAADAVLLERFVAAFVGQDVDALVALLAEDVWVRMPPLSYEYRGRAAAREFFSALDGHRRNVAAMVPVGVNRQAAWGEYVRDDGSGTLRLVGLLVAEVHGNRIGELTHFESGVAVLCGLPRTLD